jgi:secondary thiamine-phosphate synthase enzyme
MTIFVLFAFYGTNKYYCRMKSLSISTRQREELIKINSQLQEIVKQNAWQNGALLVFCPHTTCALTINEGADPDVAADMLSYFSRLIPEKSGWRHVEGNSDAHIKSSMIGVSLMLPVEDEKIRLGTWQSVYLYEGDGPRQRSLWLQWLPGAHDC